MAIFPFIRQFAGVDKTYFENLSYRSLQNWLTNLTTLPLFISIMDKYPSWNNENKGVFFPEGIK